MLTLITDIIIILLLLFLLYIGYYAGIIKSFFAVTAGFFAIILAENYPYQIGINYYLVFAVTAFFIVLIGLLIFKIVKFLYLSIFDKIAGACLGFFVWFIISANFVIPVLNKSADTAETVTTKTSSYLSDFSSKTFPVFGQYIPKFIFDKKLKHSKDYILLAKEKN